MRIHVFACRVLSRELNYLASQCGSVVDLTYLPQGLHDVPATLRDRLREAHDQLYRDIASGLLKHRPDAIALGYGLCSNGVVGLVARDIPIVVPRTDDCIALFLGAQKRYLELFETMNGAYWINNGWLESCGTVVREHETRERRWQMYAEKYGEDNADFLIEQEGLWMRRYDTCAFIRSEVFHTDPYEQAARQLARDNGWSFQAMQGDLAMLKALLSGQWDDERFLICPPGYRIEAEYTGRKIKAVRA